MLTSAICVVISGGEKLKEVYCTCCFDKMFFNTFFQKCQQNKLFLLENYCFLISVKIGRNWIPNLENFNFDTSKKKV